VRALLRQFCCDYAKGVSDDLLAPEPTIRNARHKAVADDVLRGMSGSEAARQNGYNPKFANVVASQILNKPEVAEYLRYHRAKSTEQATAERKDLLRELESIAFSNVQDYTRLNEDGDLVVDFSGATREQLAAVSSVRVKKRKIYDNRGNVVGEEHNSEFRLWDKIRAAELLGKHDGLFTEPDQKIVIDVADRLLAARARVRAISAGSAAEDADYEEVEKS